jgi:hypothetical protein
LAKRPVPPVILQIQPSSASPPGVTFRTKLSVQRRSPLESWITMSATPVAMPGSAVGVKLVADAVAGP